MNELSAPTVDLLWRGALAIVPVAIVAALACRSLPCRATTRHALWLIVLVLLVAIPLLPAAPTGDLVAARTPARVKHAMPATTAPIHADVPALPAPIAAPVTPARRDGSPAVADTFTFITTERTNAARDRTAAPSRPDGYGAGLADERTLRFAVEPARDDRFHVMDASPRERVGRAWTRARGASADGAPVSASPSRAAATLAPMTGAPRDAAPWRRRSVSDAPLPAGPDAERTTSWPLSQLLVGADVSPASAATAPVPVIRASPAPKKILRADDLEAWMAPLRTTRDAVLALPPLPARIWIGGAALVAAIGIGRMIRFGRLLRRATPADRATENLVAAAAATLGLRRTPTTLMIGGHVSPMVWCGRPLRLLLPVDLWRELDEDGRRTVVQHELAHLKRRDHWVCWVTAAVGCVYWWHPVVWWVRRRIREEADLCCDAWVTALMPTARRAYATALLRTKQFTSEPQPPVAAVGLGVSTLRAKRFARRITMVMTEHGAPRTTAGGVILAATLAVAGWLVTPTLACPPSEQDAPKPPKASRPLTFVPAAPTAPAHPLRGAHAPAAPTPSAHPAPPLHPAHPAPEAMPENTFEQFMRSRDDRGDQSIEDRIEELERALDVLLERLEAWGGGVSLRNLQVPDADLQFAIVGATAPELASAESDVADCAVAKAAAAEAAGCCAAATAPDQARAQYAAEMAVAAQALSRQVAELATADRVEAQYAATLADAERLEALGGAEALTTLLAARGQLAQAGALQAYAMAADEQPGHDDGEIVIRTYELPEGKLEALTKLLVREDVPILIRPLESGIEVHATAANQHAFGMFCQLINGADQKRDYRLSQGKLEALTELMVRSDVPILVNPGDEAIRVHGTDVEQAVFEAFVRMIEPSPATYTPFDRAAALESGEENPTARMASEYEREAHSYLAELEGLHGAIEGLRKELDQYMRRHDQLLRKAEKLETKATELEDKAGQLEDEAEGIDDLEARMRILRKANDLMVKARESENEARLFEAEAEVVESQIEAIVEHEDDLQNSIEELEERVGSLKEIQADTQKKKRKGGSGAR